MLQRGAPFSGAVRGDHRVVFAFQCGEDLGAPHRFVTEQEEDANRLGLADDLYQVDLQQREVPHLGR